MEVAIDFDFTKIDETLLELAKMFMDLNLNKGDFTTYYWVDDSDNVCESEVLPITQREYLFKSYLTQRVTAYDLWGGNRKKGYQVRITVRKVTERGNQSGILEVEDWPDYYILIGFKYVPSLKMFTSSLLGGSLHPTFD